MEIMILPTYYFDITDFFFLFLSRSRKQVITINIHTNTRFSFSHVIRMYAGCYTYTSTTITTIMGINKWVVSISVYDVDDDEWTSVKMSCYIFLFSVYSYGVQLGCSSVGFDFICSNEYAQPRPELTNMISILLWMSQTSSFPLICMNKKRQYDSQFLLIV
jgi:hypothetical protein